MSQEIVVGPFGISPGDGWAPSMLTLQKTFRPGERDLTVVLHWQAVAPKSDLDLVATSQIEALRGALPSFRLVQQSRLTVGNRACPTLEYLCEGPENEVLRQLTVFVPAARDRVVVASATCLNAQYEDARAELVAMLQSVRAG